MFNHFYEKYLATIYSEGKFNEQVSSLTVLDINLVI